MTMTAMEFKIEPVESGHIYTVAIKNAATTENLSNIKLKFTTQAENVSTSKKTMDIHSLNYKASHNEFSWNSSLKHSISEITVMESSGFYMSGDSNHQVLLTLDIKQDTNFYGHSAAIQSIEQNFLTKLQSNQGQQNKLARLLNKYQSNQLQYVFMEGSLKADLLSNAEFEADVLNHFTSHGGVFCQYTEFVMNGLKRGEKVSITKDDVHLYDFLPENYIKKVHVDSPDFQPTNEVTTIYPASYHDMAIAGLYTTAMEESGTVQMNIESHSETKIVKLTVSNHVHRFFAPPNPVVEPIQNEIYAIQVAS